MTKRQRNLQIFFLAAVAVLMLLAWPHLSMGAALNQAGQAGNPFNWGGIPNLADTPTDYTGAWPQLPPEIQKELTSSGYDGTAQDLAGAWQREADATQLMADSWLWVRFTADGRGSARRQDNQTVNFTWQLQEEAYQGEDVILVDYDRTDIADEMGLVSWYGQTEFLAVDEDGVPSTWNKQATP